VFLFGDDSAVIFCPVFAAKILLPTASRVVKTNQGFNKLQRLLYNAFGKGPYSVTFASNGPLSLR
jgi:hypothetical protein